MDEMIIVLASSSEVMLAQSALYKEGITISIIGMPDTISHDCGVAIQARSEDHDKIEEILRTLPLEKVRYCRRTGEELFF